MVFYLVSGLTLGFSAAFTPGPFQAFLLSLTSKLGWMRTWPTAFAPLISDGPIIFVMVFLLARTPEWFLTALQIAGGLFLLYLAYDAFKAYRSFETDRAVEDIHDQGLGKRMLQATLMNAIGPGPYIFWSLIAGPIFLEGLRFSPLMGASFLVGFYGTLIGGNLLFITVFATTRRLGNQFNRPLIGLSALALLIFGVLQFGRGLLSLT